MASSDRLVPEGDPSQDEAQRRDGGARSLPHRINWPSPRQMTLRDLAGVLEVEREAYGFPWSEGVFRDCLRAGYRCEVLELERRIEAYGILQMAAGEAHLLNLCVSRERQGQGAGTAVLNSLIRHAGASGASALILEVRPSNTSGRRLYERMGFAQVGTRRGYYPAHAGREDAIVLSLSLGAS